MDGPGQGGDCSRDKNLQETPILRFQCEQDRIREGPQAYEQAEHQGCYIGCFYYTDSCFRVDCLKEKKDGSN